MRIDSDMLDKLACPLTRTKLSYDPERVAAVARSDQNHAALCVAHEPHPPQDEGAHDGLADVRLRLHQPQETGAWHSDDAAVVARAAIDEDLAAVEQVELAGELPVRVDVDRRFRVGRAGIQDLDRAFYHDEEIDAPLAATEQVGPGLDLLDGAEAEDPP